MARTKFNRIQTNTATKIAPMQISGGPAVTNMQAVADSVSSGVTYYGVLPYDYVSGDISIKYLLRAGANGTAVLRSTIFRMRSGVALAVIETSVNVNAVVASTTVGSGSRTVAAANVAGGDTLRIDLQRLGADGSDTLASTLDFDTCWIEYTGYVY